MSTKAFSIEVLLSAESGRLLCPFGEMHEFIEHLLGRPVWTHELADKTLWGEIAEATRASCPSLRHEGGSSLFDWWWPQHFSSITPENYRGVLGAFRSKFPEIPSSVEVAQGTSQRTESPIASLRRLAPDAEVVVVTTEKKS